MNTQLRAAVLSFAAAAIAVPVIGVHSQASAAPNIPGTVLFVQKPHEGTGAFTSRCAKQAGMVQKRKGKLVCVVPPRSSVGSMRGSYGGGRPVPIPSP